MFDFVLPAGLKEFVTPNMRLIVFSFIFIQIVVASGFAYWCYKSQFGTCIVKKNARLSFPFKRIFCFQSACDIFSFVIFSALLSLFGWLIVDNSELCWPDQSHITAGAMRGDLWMQIVPQTGRFSPLLHQEFLLLAGILKSATAYYLLAVAELILIVLGLIFILPVKSLSIRLLFTASLVFSAGFAVPISGLIFPEAHIILSLIIFLSLAKINHEHAENYGLALFSSICQIFIAIYLIYLKEPMFLVLGGYSIFYLMHEIIKKNANESISKKITSNLKKKPVEISILCASFIFAITYFFYIYLQTQERYGSKQDRGVVESLLSSFTQSPLVGLYFLVLIVRLLQLKKHTWHPVWDSMNFSFIFYYLALIIMGLSNPYYYVPISFASILLSAKIISNLQLNLLGKTCLSLVGIFIVYIGVIDSLSFFRNRELYQSLIAF